MKALNSTLVAWRAGGRRRGKKTEEGEKKEKEKKKRQNLCRPNHFSKSSEQPLQRSFEFARSLSRFGDINVRTNERGTHNKYEFLYCHRARARAAAAAVAAALAACVWRGREQRKPRTRDGTESVQ